MLDLTPAPLPPINPNRVVAHQWIPKNASWCIAQGVVVVPHCFLRSALFSGVSRHLDSLGRSAPTPVPIVRGHLLKQLSGPALTQFDADVYFALLQLALDQPPPAVEGDPIQLTVSSAALLRRSGVAVGDGSGPRRRQQSHLERLAETEIQLTRDGELVYLGPLLHVEPAPGPGLRIALPWGLGALFAGWTYTKLQLDVRQKLSPLARWLHGYFSSHSLAKLQPHGIRTLLQLTGRDGQRLDKFAAALAAAADELAEHKAQHGWLVKFDGKHFVVEDSKTPPRKPKPGAKPARRGSQTGLSPDGGALTVLMEDAMGDNGRDDDNRCSGRDDEPEQDDYRPLRGWDI